MNTVQEATAAFWGEPCDGLITCSDFRAFKNDNDDTVVCIERFIFTTAISIILGNFRVTRFCYHTKPEAVQALNDWEKTGFAGKPQNYIKQKPEPADEKNVWDYKDSQP